jgi:hypothetical protein
MPALTFELHLVQLQVHSFCYHPCLDKFELSHLIQEDLIEPILLHKTKHSSLLAVEEDSLVGYIRVPLLIGVVNPARGGMNDSFSRAKEFFDTDS